MIEPLKHEKVFLGQEWDSELLDKNLSKIFRAVNELQEKIKEYETLFSCGETDLQRKVTTLEKSVKDLNSQVAGLNRRCPLGISDLEKRLAALEVHHKAQEKINKANVLWIEDVERRLGAVEKAQQPQKPAEPIYPCQKCGKLRTKAEGGTTFTLCEKCWDKYYSKPAEPKERLFTKAEVKKIAKKFLSIEVNYHAEDWKAKDYKMLDAAIKTVEK